MIYPSTVPCKKWSLSLTAPQCSICRGGGLRGVNPPLHEDHLPTETCLGVGFDSLPEGFQEQLDKTWGTKKFSARFVLILTLILRYAKNRSRSEFVFQLVKKTCSASPQRNCTHFCVRACNGAAILAKPATKRL